MFLHSMGVLAASSAQCFACREISLSRSSRACQGRSIRSASAVELWSYLKQRRKDSRQVRGERTRVHPIKVRAHSEDKSNERMPDSKS